MIQGIDTRRLPKDEVMNLIKQDVLEEAEQVAPVDPETKKLTRTGLKEIKAILLFIVALSAATSGYFLFNWNITSRGIILSLAIAISMTSCQILLPDLAIFLAAKRKATSILGALVLVAIWIVATGFTMSATIGGIYDSRSKTLASANDEVSANAHASADALAKARDKEARLKSDLAWAKKEETDAISDVARVLQLRSKLEGLEGANIESERARLAVELKAAEARRDQARKNTANISSSLDAVGDSITQLLRAPASSIVIRDDSFTWASKIVGIEPDTIEFIMAAFPAIFNEIVAPTMLAVVLFL